MSYVGKELLYSILLLVLCPFRRLRCGWERLWGRPHLGLVVLGDGRKELPEDAEGTTHCALCGWKFGYVNEARRVERLLVDLRSKTAPTEPAARWLAFWAAKRASRERHPALHQRVGMALAARGLRLP